MITRRGVEAAVLVSIDEWRRLKNASRPGTKELLLGPGPRFNILFRRVEACVHGVPPKF